LFDAVRGLSLLVVVLGHWLIGALAFTDASGSRPVLTEASVMTANPWAAPVTWLVSVLGLFFFIGGRLSAESWSRASGQGGWSWFGRRLIRLSKPLTMVVWPVALAALLLRLAGLPPADLALAGKLLVQPLWFLVVYAVLTAATPGLAWLDRHWRWGAPVAMVAAVALVDAWRFGPWPAPSWIGWLALMPGWTLAYQLGLAWAARPWSGGLRFGLLAGGAAGTVLCWTTLGYPTLMLAGGAAVSRPTIHPPTLVMLTLMTTAIGAFVTWQRPLRRWFGSEAAPAEMDPSGAHLQALPIAEPADSAVALATAKPYHLIALVSRVNHSAVQVLALHQAAALIPVLVVATLAPGLAIPGLTAVPDGPAWLVARLAWLHVFAALLLGAIRLTTRARRGSPPPPTREQAITVRNHGDCQH